MPLPNSFKKNILKTLYKKGLKKIQEQKQVTKAEKEYREALELQAFQIKLSKLNYNILKYYKYSFLIRKIIISSFVLDLFVFLIPNNFFSFIASDYLLLANKYLVYFLFLLSVFLIFSRQIKKLYKDKLRNINKGILLLMLICILTIGIFSYQASELAEKNLWGELLVQAVFVLVAIFPITKSIRLALKFKNRPQIFNILLFINYLAPLISLRLCCLLYSISIFALNYYVINVILYMTACIFVILSIQPVYTVRNEGIKINKVIY